MTESALRDGGMRGGRAVRELRANLAAAYRLVHHYGMTDTLYTHQSVRLPGEPARFLIHPHGRLFDEICASELVEIDLDGIPTDPDAPAVNPAGFVIHSAIHMHRQDARAVMHTHTLPGMAVAALKEGLLPLNQISMAFYDRVAYHDYEGISLDLDERARLVADLGDRHCMILRNHGLLTVGRSVAEAFSRMYYLHKACEIQMQVLACSATPLVPIPEVCAHAAQQSEGDDAELELFWRAHRRMLDRIDPSYRS